MSVIVDYLHYCFIVLRRAPNLLTIFVPLLLACSIGSAQDRQAVIVAVGAEGSPEYGELFREWAGKWQQATDDGQAELVTIGLNSSATDRQQFETAVRQLSSQKSLEPVWIVLIGHGTFDGRVARFNLRGPDISAEELAEWISDAERPIAVINCSSCSSPFINAISGVDRVVISATKDGNESQFCRFGQFMAEAISGTDGDLDRDGQTSLLEAWLYASRRTDEFYESEGRLATEHSLLEDSGDRLGVRTNVFEGVRVKPTVDGKEKVDGNLARRWHLVRSPFERLLTPEERLNRDQIEVQLEELRNRRSEFDDADYLNALQELMLPLSMLYQQIEERAGRPARSTNAVSMIRELLVECYLINCSS